MTNRLLLSLVLNDSIDVYSTLLDNLYLRHLSEQTPIGLLEILK